MMFNRRPTTRRLSSLRKPSWVLFKLRLSEPTTTRGQLQIGASHVQRMQDAVYRQLLGRYNREATTFSRSLGGGDFNVTAAWKKRELKKQSLEISKSLRKTMWKERQRIKGLPQGERAVARKKLVGYKSKQLDRIINQNARFEAQTDILAHSGIADVDKARVMNFMLLGDRTCPICEGIAAGNPYTIRGATTLGAQAHPNCVDEWDEGWTTDPNMIANAQRQVRDGEVKIWDGKPRTPARGKAATKTKKMQVRKGGWTGRRIEQRKVLRQRQGTTRQEFDDNWRAYQRKRAAQ